MKNKSVASTSTYPITFGQDIIVIEILPLKKGTCILGVYLSADDSNNTTLSKVHSMVNYISYLIRKKKITHDHVLYVINNVVIPRIEYLTQHTFLSPAQCLKINTIQNY